MGGEGRFYNPKFYRELEQTRDSARVVLPIIFELLHPTSIVDIGCGAGQWLAVAMELGVADVLAVDGEWVLKTELAIPREKFLVHDLRNPVNLERKFDLAVSLEVAEHLPPENAKNFVQGLCRAADTVLFSAAIPGQGGRHHVNEQWPVYWHNLFEESGFRCYDIIRPRIWNSPGVLWYYAQNCLLFSRAEIPGQPTPTVPLPLVHPAAWSAEIARRGSPGKLLEALLKSLVPSRGRKRS
jgi:SAM-dependent methyltransferase